ncbi:MAG TPA: ATP-binding protein [Magnetospirillum sp.]|nr:ATP-binding protein [Magnetospirillum sp.]
MGHIDHLISYALDAADEAVAVNDANGRVLYVNRSFTALYGYTMDDLACMRMNDIRSPCLRHHLGPEQRHGADLGCLTYETEHRRRDGSVFPVEVSISRVALDHARYWVNILRDISARKTLDNHGARLRRLYDALLAANRAVVQSADRETLFARICATSIDFGLRLAWVGLCEGEMLVPVAWAGDGAGYLYGAISLREGEPTASSPTGAATRTCRPYICNDFFAEQGTRPWHDRARQHGIAASAAFPLVENGKAIGALSLYAGRTGFFGSDEVALLEQFAATVSLALDRLAAEQASRHLTGHPLVRTILDAVPAAVLVAHDVDCRVITGNRAAERLFRAPPGGNLTKSPPDGGLAEFRLLRSGAEAEVDELPIQMAARGRDIVDTDLEIGFDGGDVVTIRGNAMPLRDGAGKVIGAVGAFVDVTQRRHEEQALAEARDMAERAVAAKSRFLAAASHDLRQPLQGLVLMHELLAAKLEGVQADILGKAQRCASTLYEMVDDLLDVSKLDSGVIAVSKRECLVRDLVNDVLPPHEAAACAKGLALRHVRSRLQVRTDPALMRRILSNLLSNAVKYTHKGKVLIGCRRRRGVARIEVWDSGVGIPADQLANVFEEFMQLDNPERAREKGSGLGLSIVDRSARLLGVVVTVRSVPGRGSCFAIDVPLSGSAAGPSE